MADEQKSPRHGNVIQTLRQVFLCFCIKVDHDIAAKYDMHLLFKGKGGFHQVDIGKDHFISNSFYQNAPVGIIGLEVPPLPSLRQGSYLPIVIDASPGSAFWISVANILVSSYPFAN